MGVIPYELLIPLGQLKALNLSGNHLVNVSMQILHPVNELDVSRQQTIDKNQISFTFLLFYFDSIRFTAIGCITQSIERNRRKPSVNVAENQRSSIGKQSAHL